MYGKQFQIFFFNEIGIRSVFHYSFKPSKNTSQKISLFPQFYQELVSFWVSVSEKQPSSISEIVRQFIWSLLVKSNLRASLKLLDNAFGILKQGSLQSSIHAYISGIMIINDLIDTEGKFDGLEFSKT